jgi:hypothetical protein
MSARLGNLIAVVAAVGMLACLASSAEGARDATQLDATPTAPSDTSFANIRFHLYEHSGNHRYVITPEPGREVEVDDNSILVLQFTNDAFDRRMTALRGLLDATVALGKEKIALEREIVAIKPNDRNRLDATRRKIVIFGDRLVAVMGLLPELGLDNHQQLTLLSGNDSYGALGKWVAGELDRMWSTAGKPTAGQYVPWVTVDGFREQRGAARQGLPIDDWNEIAMGNTESVSAPGNSRDASFAIAAAEAAEALKLVQSLARQADSLAATRNGARIDSLDTAAAPDTPGEKRIKPLESAEGLIDAVAASKPPDHIERNALNLVPARFPLELLDLSEGDHVHIKLRFLSPDSGRRVVHQKDYFARVTPLGVYARTRGIAVFERRDKGDDADQKWKLNVGAMHSWHYRYRSPSGWGRIWNWLDPSLGMHAANVDHTDDPIEIGLGLSFSISDDLIFTGVGWNLALSEDREYFLLGARLIEVLNRVRELSGPKSEAAAK